MKLDVARREIERHEERIVQLQANVLRLEEEVKILSTQRFLKRFEGSDSDIQFYTVERNGSITLFPRTEPLTLARRAAIKTIETELKLMYISLPPVSKVYVTSTRMLRTRL